MQKVDLFKGVTPRKHYMSKCSKYLVLSAYPVRNETQTACI